MKCGGSKRNMPDRIAVYAGVEWDVLSDAELARTL